MTKSPILRALRFLEKHDIPYERHDHPAVFSVEDVSKTVSIEKGARTKNLFVRDKKGRRHLLIVAPFDRTLDLMKLGVHTGLGRLSFASPERLLKYLGVEPGSVTLLGVINDPNQFVEVVIDSSIWEADYVRCHPLINTSTLVIDQNGLRAIFAATGHKPTIMRVPSQ